MRAQWMIALGTAGANVPQEYAQKVRVAREKLAEWERQPDDIVEYYSGCGLASSGLEVDGRPLDPDG